MSRSRRKSPITGMTTAKSEKNDKRQANRRLRKAVKRAVCEDQEIMPDLRDVSDVWGFSKDGRQLIDPNSKWMRK